ncbi:MAG TPA: hypothetical protein VK790_03590 [Solirubrobacteraceae bacterium]|nr:hypothetical protein [Solirubrobacteraceae bacterium]
MIDANSAWRVPVVVRPLDRLFALTKIVVIPALLFGVAAPTLNALTGVGSAGGLVGAGLLTIVYVVVLQLQTVEQRVDRLFAFARRYVALSCDHDFRSSHRDGLACLLTAEALRVPVFRYEAQQAAVTALADACDADAHGQFWFVEGTSGSGKTRTALLLVQTLIRDLRRFELGSHCYLYDFADADQVQDELLRCLGSPRNDGVVVLVDNFQLVRADILRIITERLLDRPGRAHERLVVFLARPGDAWNLSPGADVRILSEAKSAKHHVSLTGPLAEEVVRRVAALDETAASQLRQLNSEPVATAAQLHFAQVIVRNASVPDDVRNLLGLLVGAVPSGHDDLLRALGTVTAMTVHRGAFRRAELRALSSRAATQSSRRATATALSDLQRLHRVGLVAKLNVGGVRFVFHEAIAELCIDRLTGLSPFDEAFGGVGAQRLVALRERREALGAWLVAAETNAQDVLAEMFDAAMACGAYARMAGCLRRAAARYRLDETSRLQLAILLDRVGDFAASRALIGDAWPAHGADRLAAMLTAQRIEAGHDERSLQDAAVLRASEDPEVALIGEYWDLHMAAHRGRFAPERLLELATEVAGLPVDHDDYWTIYAMARMHFDSLRHHYLTGGWPVEALTSPPRQNLDDVISRHLPTFEALHVLYGEAHLVAHVLLPRRALFGEPVAPGHTALAQISMQDAESEDALAVAAERLYRRARDEFWQYGDREASYLQADVLNVRMIQTGADLDALSADLHTYERFVEDTGFVDIRSYPQLYYMRWHILRHFAGLVAPDSAARILDGDAELDQAARRLERAVLYDTAVENEYGLYRAELFGMLLEALRRRQPFDPTAALALAERMSARRYGFGAELLRHLANSGTVRIMGLLAAFRYYPIVHQ